MNRLICRLALAMLSLVAASSAWAVGFGDLTSQAVLGNRLYVRISLLGQPGRLPDERCFQLVRPVSERGLPWLAKASLQLVRQDKIPVLEIVSEEPLRDPVLTIALKVGCGHELYREYAVLASPEFSRDLPSSPRAAQGIARSTTRNEEKRPLALPVPATRSPVVGEVPTASERPAKPQPKGEISPAADQLRLSGALTEQGETKAGVPGGGVVSTGPDIDTQRELLRLEGRMLELMRTEARTQEEALEKLREMQAILETLDAQAPPVSSPGETASPETAVVPPVSQPRPAAMTGPSPQSDEDPLLAWGFYGLLLGLLCGLVGWIIWRNRQAATDAVDVDADRSLAKLVDPLRPAESEGLPPAAAVAEVAVADVAMEVVDTTADQGGFVERDGDLSSAGDVERQSPSPVPVVSAIPGARAEANPVMELADIMLSFGRVKGAAQTLQEYIDHNPEDALQPWIRLMDVYRMAGMREEFEAVAANLNKHFNVEVQAWDAMSAAGSVQSLPEIDTRPQGIEEMPRIIARIVEMWSGEDVVGYLYELLRDNRGGQRVGFSLPVVEDILFLIELKETSNRMGPG